MSPVWERKSSIDRGMGVPSKCFSAEGDLFQHIRAHLDAQTGASGDGERAVGIEGKRLGDHVFGVVAGGGGDIAGQGEARKRCHRHIGGAPDARLQHAAHPDRHAASAAVIVNANRFGIAANAGGLDVDDTAGAKLQRPARMGGGSDAFVEANGRLELRLQFGVIDDVVVRQAARSAASPDHPWL